MTKTLENRPLLSEPRQTSSLQWFATDLEGTGASTNSGDPADVNIGQLHPSVVAAYGEGPRPLLAENFP